MPLTIESIEQSSSGEPSLCSHLEQNVWPNIPVNESERVLTRQEEDNILGYGPEGF